MRHAFSAFIRICVLNEENFLSGRSICNSHCWLSPLPICQDYLGFPDCGPSLPESTPYSPTLVLLSLCGANTHKKCQGQCFSFVFLRYSFALSLIWRLDHSCELLVVPAGCEDIRSFSLSGNVNWKLRKRLRSKELFSSKSSIN